MDKNKIIEAATKFVQKGQYDKAIKEYQKLLEADPKDTRILQKVGELFQKKGDNGQAADYFLKVGESYSADGFFLKAVAVYKQVLKLDDKRIDVNLKLAELYQQLGLMSDAMAQLQIVSGHYEKSGNGAASLDLLKRMVELDPDNVASRIKLAELYARDSLNTEAISEFQKAAQYLKRNNRIDDYIKVAERLVFLDPDNTELARELAQIYLAKQDTKRALAKLQVCFKADPRDVETLTLLAQAFHELGQTSKTVSVYKELAKIYDETDKVDEERGIWEKIRELAPDDPDAQKKLAPPSAANVGAAPAAYQQPAAAAQPAASSRAQPARPAEPSGPVGPEQIAKLLTETDVYVKYGLHDKALEHLKKVFAADPDNLDGHDKAYALAKATNNHGRAEEELLFVIRGALAIGDFERARARLQSLLESNPGHPEVAGFLEAIGQAPAPEAVAEEVVDDSILIDSAEAEVMEHAEVVEDGQPELLTSDDEALVAASGGDDELLAAADEPLVASDSTMVAASDDEALLAASGDDEQLVAASDDESLLASGDEQLVASDDDGLLASGDEQLVSDSGDELVAADPEPVTYEGATDEGLVTADDEALVAAGEDLVSADDVVAGSDDGPLSTMQYTDPSAVIAEQQVAASGDDDLFAVPSEGDSDQVEDPNDQTSPQLAAAARGADESSFADLNDGPVAPMDDPEPMAGEGDGATRVVNLADLAKADERATVAKMQVAPPEAIGTSARMGVARPSTRPGTTQPAVKLETKPVVKAAPEAPAAKPSARPASKGVAAAKSAARPPSSIETAAVAVGVAPAAPPGDGDDGDAALDELEEAAFFISQGDLDEARDILETVMLAFPGNARAQELMAELEAKANGPSAPADDAAPAGGGDNAFDLAAELAEELGDAPAEQPAAPLNPGQDGFQISHEDVFAEFKKGVSKVVKPEDVETHYDLGVAYKEMGLQNDAVSEFEQAMAGAIGKAREVDCYVAIGACKREGGDMAGAIEAYRKGLSLAQVTVDSTKAMLYDLATALEAMGQPNKALANFNKIATLDPKYRDVASQVQRLIGEGAEPEDDSPKVTGSKGSNGANGIHVNGKGGTSVPSGAAAKAEPKDPPPAGGKPTSRKIGYV